MTDYDKIEAIDALRSIGELSAPRILSLCHDNMAELLELRRWYLADYRGDNEGGYFDYQFQRQRSDDVVPLVAEAISRRLEGGPQPQTGTTIVDLYVDVPRRGAPTESWHRRWRPPVIPQPKSELVWTADGQVDLRIKVDRLLLYATGHRAVAYGHLMYPWSRSSVLTRLTTHGFSEKRRAV